MYMPHERLVYIIALFVAFQHDRAKQHDRIEARRRENEKREASRLSVMKDQKNVLRQVLETVLFLCNHGWTAKSVEYRRGQRSGQVEVSVKIR